MYISIYKKDHELIRREGVINKIGSLFVIIDKTTFSAAANLATDLEREIWAIFVGEPTGMRVNSFGDHNHLQLPRSKINLGISSVYWVKTDARDQRNYIHPDIVVRENFQNYSKGYDEAFRSILTWKIPDEYKNLAETITPWMKWYRDSQKLKWQNYFEIE